MPTRVRIVLFFVVTTAMILTWLVPTRTTPSTAVPDQNRGLPQVIAADPPNPLAGQRRGSDSRSSGGPLTIRTVDASTRTAISEVRIVDADVTALSDRIESTLTDTNGEAQIWVGDRRVVAVKTGYVPKAVMLSLEMTGTHEIALAPVQRMNGRIVDASGAPASGARVRFIPSIGQLPNLNSRVQGFGGFFSEGMLTVGYEATSDADGRFSIPIPETQSTVRISSPSGRWIPESQDQREGRASPPGGVYMLRELFKFRILVNDSASGERIPDPWVSLDGPLGSVAADAPWESTEIEESETDGVAGFFVRGFLLDPTQTVVMLRLGAPAYEPKVVRFQVRSSRSEEWNVETVELRPIASQRMSRLRLRVADGVERGDDPSFVGVLQADAADVVDVGVRVIGFRKADRYVAEVSVPAGTYTFSAATPSQGITTFEGRRTVAVIRFISSRTIVLPAGQVVEESIVLPDDELLELDLTYPGSRPNRLFLISPDGQGSLLKREIVIVPGPDRILLHTTKGEVGSLVVGGDGLRASVIRVSAIRGVPQRVDLKMERARR